MPFYGLPQGVTNPPRHSLTPEERAAFVHDERSRMGPAPGTFVLVFVFLAAFMTYFFVNWKMLSFLWQIG
jgi:hypothetical protein